MQRAILPWAFLATFLLHLSVAARVESKSAAVTSNIHVASAQAVSKTDDVWACANLDWWPMDKCDYGMCPWGQSGVPNINFNQTMLQLAVAAFDGAFHLRLGGSLSDFVLYNVSSTDAATCVPFSPATNATRLGYNYFTGCLSLKRWNEILDFALLANISVVFGVSALHGRVQPPPCPDGTNCPAPDRPSCCTGPWGGDWQSDNLKELLDYTLATGYRNIYALEFGNELAGQYVFARAVLRRLLSLRGHRQQRICAPLRVAASDARSRQLVGRRLVLPIPEAAGQQAHARHRVSPPVLSRRRL